ncbi:hypothetical protein [Saccharothrix sp. ST-888]|uniref:hypothetical protein n=1 Tax=Saccharothrix sp. ST-888 TaxID=1427391 RepID=UPI0005EC2C46|nr:hypothetical protein [Saccharothrix sp. ST-888]KJK55192.1 hypothetical protein UK12_30130 [Saccharothrix sp. ST-888]
MMQPTRTAQTLAFPERPAHDYRRPAVMAALALTEHLVAAQVPVPASITITTPLRPGQEATVEAMVSHDLLAVCAWQDAFGGELTHELYGDDKVYSQVSGRAYDAPFRIWTLRRITPAQQHAEQQMLAHWIEDNGPEHTWADDTRATYKATRLRYRLEVAR